jgi:hypothetical protein
MTSVLGALTVPPGIAIKHHTHQPLVPPERLQSLGITIEHFDVSFCVRSYRQPIITLSSFNSGARFRGNPRMALIKNVTDRLAAAACRGQMS